MNLFYTLKKGAALSLVFTVLNTSLASANSLGLVTGDNVNLRSSNSADSAVISKLNNGETVNILSDFDGWFKISSPAIGEAFVTSEFVKVTKVEGTVVSNGVNIRTSPSNDAEVTGQVGNGDLVNVQGILDNWYEIEHNGSVAYISKDFLSGNMLKYVPKVTEKPIVKNEKTEEKETPSIAKVSNDVYAVVSSGGTSLNLRNEPSTNAQVIKSISDGYALNVYDVHNGWVKVSDDSGNLGYVSSDFVTLKNGKKPQNQSLETSSSLANEIIAYAKQFLGTPYVYGGTNLKTGVDCSGFTYSVFKEFGINLNRSSSQQVRNGTPVSRSALLPGDLIFFDTTGENNGQISHVGIYIGNGQYIQASSGKAYSVVITSLGEPYSSRTYVSACRVLK